MEIKKEFEKNLDKIISDLRGLISIPSIAGPAEGAYPFGKAVQDALEYMLRLGASMGFAVKNVDNYGGHIDFPGRGEGVMAIVSHIDVVPAGEGWTHDPFGGAVADGWMYGRGTQDDKGAAIIGLYAMKILKDLGFQPQKTIRLILGLDEETNWEGIRYYLQRERAPDFGIVPDADFPLIQCEKGLLQFNLLQENSGSFAIAAAAGCVLESFTGGTAPNVVPSRVQLCLGGSEKALTAAKVQIRQQALAKKYKCETKAEQGALKVTVMGKSAHAAYPERGINAISLAMDLMRDFVFENEEANRLIKFYNRAIGLTLDGGGIGCGFRDDLSGGLTFNTGAITFNARETRITADVRYPVTKEKTTVYEGIKPLIEAEGFRIEEIDHIAPIYQEGDHPVVKTLIAVYQQITGDYESRPTVTGGATFARAVPGCLAFGPLFPGDSELEHQKDEGVELSQLLKAGEIYAESLYRLTI